MLNIFDKTIKGDNACDLKDLNLMFICIQSFEGTYSTRNVL